MNQPDDPLSSRDRRAVTASVRGYSRLLFVYPENFREEYAGEMARYFEEVCEDTLRRGGLPALAFVWIKTLYELVGSARAERKQTLPDTPRDISLAVWAGLLGCPGCGQLYNDQPFKAAAHALIFLALFLGGLSWSALGGLPWYAWLAAAGLAGTYSAFDAWITARRINEALSGGR